MKAALPLLAVLSLALAGCSSAEAPPLEITDRLPAPGVAPAPQPIAGPQPVAGPGEIGPDGQPVAAEPAANCNAQYAQFLVGLPYDGSTREAAARATGTRNVRAIGPDDVVTMDFDPTRLNLVADRQNRVAEVRCG